MGMGVQNGYNWRTPQLPSLLQRPPVRTRNGKSVLWESHPIACDKGWGKGREKKPCLGSVNCRKGISPVPAPHPTPTAQLCALEGSRFDHYSLHPPLGGPMLYDQTGDLPCSWPIAVVR